MSKKLVIVESPTKAKTISKFLGKGYDVRSSYGHIRDLPDSAKEIPANVKKEPWARLGINIDKDFEPLYIISADKKKRVKELKDLLKEADEIYLATDEDREGESISWHLLEVLKPKVPVKRMVFHEITKEAIQAAINSPRDVDMHLVEAQETRRVVDRLYGYTVSPLLWKKMAPRLSAGRVQSVVLRLLVERERERISFRSGTYWDLKATFAKDSQEFDAELFSYKNQRIASGKDFDPINGKLTATSKVLLLNAEESDKLRTELKKQTAKISEVDSKPYTTKPYAPFTTSTIQQEANRKLRFSAQRTMRLAQTLYENGYITYMRTDSTTLSAEAIDGARKIISNEFGKEYLPTAPREYKTKVKNAQEAHEAIRPAGSNFADPQDVKKALGEDEFKLYEMIWKRMLACQMKDAEGNRQSLSVQLGDAVFKASGKTITFPGFLRAYVEGSDDPEAEIADQEKILPALKVSEELSTKKLDTFEHKTQSPARYTEGSLIKELEKRGIGRPSTWASVVNLVLTRTYAFKKGTALVPSFLAQALVGLLENYFTNLVDYSFTAQLEDDLDEISLGKSNRLTYLTSFYHGNGHLGLKALVEKGEETIDPRIVCGLEIGHDANGVKLEVRIGRYGPFLTNGETRAGLPEELAPDELTMERALELIATAERGPESLGIEPESGLPVFLKTGRYGPYVQLGEKTEDYPKPKMASLLSNQVAIDLTLEQAIGLLSLPRKIGTFPDNNEDIVAANGRFGPYLKAGTETRSLNLANHSPVTVTLEEAIEILRTPKTRGRQTVASVLKELGVHPVTNKKLQIKNGKYGPYVTDGKLNASVPKDKSPEEVTLEDAVNLLSLRAEQIKNK